MLRPTDVRHAATGMVALSLLTISPAHAGQKPKEWGPAIDPSNFVGQVTNQYFPLPPGRMWLLRGATKSGTETLKIEVQGTRSILGVTTTVVIETAQLGGQTIEIAENWFAQDREGNVWYFGESTREFSNGSPVSTAGSWMAGVNGAQAGIIMKANPQQGDTYFQEFAPGIAQDMASVIGTGGTERAMGRTFSEVLLTKEWTSLEPSSVEHKTYAPGIGLIVEEKGGDRLELVEMR